jgi:uncharacterized DUF497 family protein
MDFEWDRNKAQANESKHGVSFEEATEVFADDYSFVVADPDHSREEDALSYSEDVRRQVPRGRVHETR